MMKYAACASLWGKALCATILLFRASFLLYSVYPDTLMSVPITLLLLLKSWPFNVASATRVGGVDGERECVIVFFGVCWRAKDDKYRQKQGHQHM